MNKTTLKKYLNSLSSDVLIKVVLQLHDLHEVNRDFLANVVEPSNEAELLVKYKKIIKNEFFPEKGDPKLRYSILRKAINEYKKISSAPELIAELMLYYVENGIDFTLQYGDIDEHFYDVIANMFNESIEYIFKHDLENKLKTKCMTLMSSTDEMGWGFYENLLNIFYEYYEEDFDDIESDHEEHEAREE